MALWEGDKETNREDECDQCVLYVYMKMAQKTHNFIQHVYT